MSILGTEPGRPRRKVERTERDSPPSGVITAVLFGISAALFGLGIWGGEDFSFVCGLGFIALTGSVLWTGAFLFEDCVLASEEDLLEAFARRDRRGRRVPGPRLWFHLWDKKTDRRKLLAKQPAGLLLALAGEKKEAAADREIAEALGLPLSGEDLPARFARHGQASVLTRIAFILRGGQAAAEAEKTLPKHLWPHALEALLASPQGAARCAAVGCGDIPRYRLLKLAGRDPDYQVRRAAAERVRGDLSVGEALALLGSPHPDARLVAAGSPALPRRRLAKLCARDENEAVRAAAWERLKEDLEASEAAILSRSPVPEVVRQAVESGALSRWRLRRVAARRELPSGLRWLARERVQKRRKEAEPHA